MVESKLSDSVFLQLDVRSSVLFHMVQLPMEKLSSKMSRRWDFSKKNAIFDYFLCPPPLRKVRNHYLDNFDASKNLKSGIFSSKMGSKTPMKSVYPGLCPPKKMFLGRFFRKPFNSNKKSSKNKVHLFLNFAFGRTLPTHENVYEGLNALKYIWRLKCSKM